MLVTTGTTVSVVNSVNHITVVAPIYGRLLQLHTFIFKRLYMYLLSLIIKCLS